MSASFTVSRVSTGPAAAWGRVDEPAGWILVVRVAGDLDIATVPPLRLALNRHLAWSRPRRLVVDLSGVTLLSSAALTLLLELDDPPTTPDRHLVLVGTDRRAVHRPLRVTGLLAQFDTRPDLESATGRPAHIPQPRRSR